MHAREIREATHEDVPRLYRLCHNCGVRLTSVRASVPARHLARSLLRLRELCRIRPASGKLVRAGMTASRLGYRGHVFPALTDHLGDLAG
jgi:hypothetical protein